jgi:hypothetical protein
MPVKRRQPEHRLHRITPDAVAAFTAGDRAALHRALGLPPWVPSPLRVGDGPCPWSPGTMGHETWPLAEELRDALIAAGVGS